MNNKLISLSIPGIIILGLVFFFRPWFQPFFLALYTNPFLVQSMLLAGIISGAVFWKLEKSKGEDEFVDSGGTAGTVFMVLAFVFFMAGGVLNTAYSNVAMANDLSAQYNEINELPDVDNDNPRILPRSVADEFAENSLQEPRHRLGSSDIAISENGTPQWSYPLSPDGFANTFLINQRGAAFVDMSTSSSDINYNSQEMDVGIGMQITDNINWQQRKEVYHVNYEDHFMVEHEGDNHLATPYVKYDHRFTFPIIYTVPKWGGIALTDNNGNIDYIDSEDVQNHEILQNQRNYPFELAHQYVSAMEYLEGVINKWFFHENQLEVAPVPGFNNDQPFMILTEDNPGLFIATEPFGDASGLFEIWTIDAVTGEYELYSLDRDTGLLGANRAVNFVRQANSRVDWADSDSNTGFQPIEPLPVIVDDTLYWQVRVVPLDGAGIAFTSFVDAETSNVFTAETDEEIIEFLEGEELDEAVTVGEDGEPQQIDESDTETSGDIEIAIVQDGEVVETFNTDSRDFDIQIREE